jgi:hypothetical protein
MSIAVLARFSAAKYPNGWKTVKPYPRMIAQPDGRSSETAPAAPIPPACPAPEWVRLLA